MLYSSRISVEYCRELLNEKLFANKYDDLLVKLTELCHSIVRIRSFPEKLAFKFKANEGAATSIYNIWNRIETNAKNRSTNHRSLSCKRIHEKWKWQKHLHQYVPLRNMIIIDDSAIQICIRTVACDVISLYSDLHGKLPGSKRGKGVYVMRWQVYKYWYEFR